MMKSQPAAEMGIKAMLKGKPSVLPGFLNKLTVFAMRFLPRSMAAMTAALLMNQKHASAKGRTASA